MYNRLLRLLVAVEDAQNNPDENPRRKKYGDQTMEPVLHFRFLLDDHSSLPSVSSWSYDNGVGMMHHSGVWMVHLWL